MLDAFKIAIKKTFSGKFLKFIFGSSATSAIGVFLLYKTILGGTTKESVILATILIVFFLFCRFFLHFIVIVGTKAWEKFQGKKFQDSITNQRNVFSIIHSAQRDISEQTKNLNNLISICDSIKKLFDEKTKNNCSVSIKMLAKNDGDSKNIAEVKNICRDSTSKKSRSSELYNEKKHYILGNTPFNTIVTRLVAKNKIQYYINNSIPKTPEYYNSSSNVWTNGLPYKSELVVPLMPLLQDNSQKSTYTINGFLCIDSAEENCFDEKFDPPLIQSIAEDIYDYLNSWELCNA